MTDNDWRPPPDVPRAASFKIAFCSDPACGLHLIAQDAAEQPICEVVMTAEQTLMVINESANHLYEKATRR